MSFIPPGDTITKGFLKPSNLKDAVAYKVKVIDYKRTEGGKFPDKDGYSTTYVLEVHDPKLEEIADKDGLVVFNCNSKRLRTAIDAEDINLGDTITLMTKGQGFDKEYTVVKLESADKADTVSIEDV